MTRSVEVTSMPVRAVLFDLFGTVVHFSSRPRPADGEAAPPAVALHWLEKAAQQEIPDVPFAELVAALARVSEEIVRARPPEYREVPSRERFRRAVQLAGVPPERATSVGTRLSRTHMNHLVSLTFLPEGYEPLLRRLARRYRLGLVSNFDDASTARRILDVHGIADVFETTVISEEFGHRKPNPAIFRHALQGLGVTPRESLFVGDTFADDVGGALGAGVPVVWLNAEGRPVSPGDPVPHHVIRRLTELPGVVPAP